MKITKEEVERLEVNTRQFLKLMKEGNYADARSIATMLQHATYTLDAAWMNGYKARTGAKP